MKEDVEQFIVKGLIEDREYFRNVVNNLDADHFDETNKNIVNIIKGHFHKYDTIPTYDVMVTTLRGMRETMNKDLFADIVTGLKFIKKLEVGQDEWLLDETKNFVKNKAMEALLFRGAEYIEDPNDEKNDMGQIYKDMESIVSMSWDEDLGIEYGDLLQFDEVYDDLESISQRIPTGISALDDAIGGGIETNTSALYVACGGSGVGKTIFLQNIASNAIKANRNVIYLSFEITEKQLRKRIDGTFCEEDLSRIISMRAKVKEKIKDMYATGTVGRLFIKEYPTGSCNAIDIENYVSKLKMQKDFEPDLIVVDYLGIMKPMNSGKNSNSYERTKMVCEELRSLSGKLKVPVFSASQLNRSGYNGDNPGLDNISDSMGIAHTADLVISLVQPEELKEDNKIRFEVLKSRLSRTGDVGYFTIEYDHLKIINERESEEKQDSDIASMVKKHKEKKTIKSNGIK